jgi:hypothetical protein
LMPDYKTLVKVKKEIVELRELADAIKVVTSIKAARLPLAWKEDLKSLLRQNPIVQLILKDDEFDLMARGNAGRGYAAGWHGMVHNSPSQ